MDEEIMINEENVKEANGPETNDEQHENKQVDDQQVKDTNVNTDEGSPAKNNNDDTRGNKNQVLLRGVIRSVRQELNDQEREENILSITTPNYLRFDNIVPAVVDVYWGNNDRTSEMIGDKFHAGDHVKVYAECRTFWNEIRRGTILYGVSIEKDTPNELTGLGDFAPPMNEAIFIGTLRSVVQPRNAETDPERSRFRFVNLALHTQSNDREVGSYPSVIVAGRVAQAFNRNRTLLANGKKIGMACHLQIRTNQETGVRSISWVAHDIIGYTESDEPVRIDIPRPNTYRAPRNNRNRPRRFVTAMADAEDMKALAKNQEPPAPDDNTKSVAHVAEPQKETEPEEFITYTRDNKPLENGAEFDPSRFSLEEIRRRANEEAYNNAIASAENDTTE